jgi:hypothetical protein
VSITAGAQYAERFAVPPLHVEFPDDAIDPGVEVPDVAVFPKKMCKCVARTRPGNTIGSSKLMCEYWQLIRNAAVPSTTDFV